MIPEIEPHVFSNAVRSFWRTRDTQASNQERRGGSDTGTRTAVTGGHQMDGFTSVIREFILSSGVLPSEIFSSHDKEVPGFFRPTKDWDILVVSKHRLLAAIELKSQVGPSFGNNCNNRVEEAIGSAVDLWTAYREGAFEASPQPWLGYLFLLEDCPKSRSLVKVSEPHFSVLPEFKRVSYAQRYELLCRKLVRERHYSSACFLMANKDRADASDNYSEPSNDLAANQFLTQLINHLNVEHGNT